MRLSVVIGLILSTLSVTTGWAQDKVRYGSAIKLSPVFYLPILAAQEKGIFKKNRLDVEWVPSQSGPDLQRNLASSVVQIGSSTGGGDIPAIGRGVPAIIVANLQSNDDFAVWILGNSRLQKPEDLKGAKIGVSRLSGAEHAYGRLVAKQLGLTNDIQFVAAGGVRESIALMLTGGVDAVVLSPHNLIDLQIQGRVKELLRVGSYEAKPWLSYTIIAAKAFVEKQPDVAKRTLNSIFEANRFIMSSDGRPWTIAKMKEENKYSDQAAEVAYTTLSLSPDGKLEKEAVKNVVNFMAEFGLVNAADVSNVDTLFTDQFVR